MTNVGNTIVVQQDWEDKLQERLAEPNKWKDICNVIYSDTQIINQPYKQNAAAQSGTRGTVMCPTLIVETNEYVQINQYKFCYDFIDDADLAQSKFSDLMGLASDQGVSLNIQIEAAVLAQYANATDFGVGDLDASSVGDTTQITPSTTNMDDIISALDKTIRDNSGQDVANRNGKFIVWTTRDFQVLQQFAMANGFNTADAALRDGLPDGGFNYMGFTHYSSNSLTANHVFAGVKKVLLLGILRSTYGRSKFVVNPGERSGIGIESRVDYGLKVQTNFKPVLFDVNVTA